MGAEDPNILVAVEFEVFGQVQGCFFTKYCKELAEELGICGWIKNTKNGTIIGKVQGSKGHLDQMVEWLSTTGSPGCKIEKCDLTNWQYLSRLDYHNFSDEKIINTSRNLQPLETVSSLYQMSYSVADDLNKSSILYNLHNRLLVLALILLQYTSW